MSGSMVLVPECPDGYVVDLKVRQGVWIYKGQMVAILKRPKLDKPEVGDVGNGQTAIVKVKCDQAGKVIKLLKKNGDVVKAGDVLMDVSSECSHPTLMKNMCAECGADLQRDGISSDAPSLAQASVSVVHSIPELKVSTDEALVLGKEDETRLVKNRRLVLLVDLDQTLIHTTNENIAPNIKDVYHFQLYGTRSPWYHTRIRPGTAEFLQRISKYYELHICTFGARLYAHTIANFLDQDCQYFSHRILSRDECFDNRSKTANLSSLFPCGDHMVCIIDDREDVWNYAPNLVHVKPYIFFKNTGDINAPPGLPPKFTPSSQPDVDYQRTARTAASETKSPDVASSSETGDVSAQNVDEDNDKTGRRDGFERRDSIDMPSLDEEEADETKDFKDGVNGAASGDLDMSDEDDNSSSSSSSDSSSSNDTEKEGATKSEVAPSKAGDEPTKSNIKEETKSSSDTKNESDLKPEESSDKTGVTPSEMIIECKEKASKSETELVEPKTDQDSKPKEVESEKEKKSESESEKDKKTGSSETTSSKEAEDDLIEMEDNDDYLMYLEDILKTIHKAYFDLYDQMKEQEVEESKKKGPDLKIVIPYVKRKVLQGTTLVFSGVNPTHVSLEKSKPYLVAKSLGAKVSDRINRDTTHLVAAKLGTAKVNDARKMGNVKLVTPDWLWGCAERWEHIDERLYPLSKAATVTIKPPAHCSSPEIAFAERCPPVPKDLTRSGNESPSRMPETLNPFLAFSSEDLQGMDKEVEDILSGDSSSDSSDADLLFKSSQNASVDSSEDSMTGEFPRGHKRKKEEDDDDSSEDSLNVEYPRAPKRSKEEDEQDTDVDETVDTDAEIVDRFRHGQTVPTDYEIATQSDDDVDAGGEDDGTWSRFTDGLVGRQVIVLSPVIQIHSTLNVQPKASYIE